MPKNVIKPATPAPSGHPTSFSGKGKGPVNTPSNPPRSTPAPVAPNTNTAFTRERAQQVKAGKPVAMSQ